MVPPSSDQVSRVWPYSGTRAALAVFIYVTPVSYTHLVAAIEHDGGEAGGNAGLGTLIGAVIQMQGNGNGDAQALVLSLIHIWVRMQYTVIEFFQSVYTL